MPPIRAGYDTKKLPRGDNIRAMIHESCDARELCAEAASSARKYSNYDVRELGGVHFFVGRQPGSVEMFFGASPERPLGGPVGCPYFLGGVAPGQPLVGLGSHSRRPAGRPSFPPP